MRKRIGVLRLGVMPYRWALFFMEHLAEARRRDRVDDLLLIVQHPPVITLGRGGGAEDLLVSEDTLQRLGVDIFQTERGGRITYHGPGQLVAYFILKLSDGDLHAYVRRLEQVVIDLLAWYGIAAGRIGRHPGVWVGRNKIAAVGVAVRGGVTTHGLALNVDPFMEHFSLIVPCGLTDKGVTSMGIELGRQLDVATVEPRFVDAFARTFDFEVTWGIQEAPWLVVPAPQGERIETLDSLLDDLGLHTVCQEALCPNISDCWGSGTATFMILGSICTRHCRFCAVRAGRPLPPDPEEPEKVAVAAARLGLGHVVITSVDRDDLPDGGAGHFAATINAVRRVCPGASVEVLLPDFGGSLESLGQVIAARPDILNHNLETVSRLFPSVQPRADYRRSLGLLAWAKEAGLTTKSGLMLGLGETRGEVVAAMQDLRRAGCSLLTLGQYLRPAPHCTPVAEYVHPVEFEWYREVGVAMGFQAVAAGPLVRSSHHAEALWASVNR
ncbi:MAG: lipoyl synthase [Chloroflexota bacterium]|nr:lipoyl synthase [Chloroflexota bacterium]